MTTDEDKPKPKLNAPKKAVQLPPTKASIPGAPKRLQLPDLSKKAQAKQPPQPVAKPKAVAPQRPNEAKTPAKAPAGKLSKILALDRQTELQQVWDATPAAEEFSPLPPGEYTAWLVKGELTESKSRETPGYQIEFQIVEGDYRGRRCWHRVWLTTAAAPMTKRELSKIGITSVQQLDWPVPQRLICSVTLALRMNDAGVQYNEVRSFTVLRTETSLDDPYAPVDLLHRDSDNQAGGVG